MKSNIPIYHSYSYPLRSPLLTQASTILLGQISCGLCAQPLQKRRLSMGGQHTFLHSLSMYIISTLQDLIYLISTLVNFKIIFNISYYIDKNEQYQNYLKILLAQALHIYLTLSLFLISLFLSPLSVSLSLSALFPLNSKN